ncbi:N-acetylneuraminate synthase family protein [Hahella ganghwensis]|uniref:N-acetylneuraminate synthase family protein n=1 Tax=Hahella ganghwensis TaxID=286420 RepID=UPI00037A28E5|nr:N-acetylneuraminate synthase family protein [Hahella ganghwensis]
MYKSQFDIGQRRVGTGKPCYVIAEIGSNHNGQLDTAIKMVKACAEAGVDAVKFQDFSREDLFIPRLPEDATPDWGQRESLLEKRWDILPFYSADPDWWPILAEQCKELGVDFLCSPFSLDAVDRLASIPVPAFKVASGDITWLELIRKIAATGIPLILSTGASDIHDVEAAISAATQAGCEQLVLLHCVSNYPPKWEDANLLAIRTLAERFGVPVGLSDHTPGSTLPVASLSMGCCVLEKHVTLDRRQEGLDHHFALEVPEFKVLVEDIRNAEKALGSGEKSWAASEEIERYWVRRGLWAAKDIRAGEVILRAHLQCVRPAQGLPVNALDSVVGTKAKSFIKAGYPIPLEQLGGETSED